MGEDKRRDTTREKETRKVEEKEMGGGSKYGRSRSVEEVESRK